MGLPTLPPMVPNQNLLVSGYFFKRVVFNFCAKVYHSL